MKYVNVLVVAALLSVPGTARAQGDRAATVSPPDQPKPAPVVPRAPTRRRGSMVGYLESALVETRVRVRFDIGMHNDAPDRVEFFYAKCGCYRDLHGDPAFDPDAPGPGPGVVTDLNFRQLYGLVEFAAGPRVSMFVELPLRWVEPKEFAPDTGEFEKTSGVGDVTAGVKGELVSAPTHVVSLQVKAFLPTGDALKGLGTHHASVEPSLLVYAQPAEKVAIESQAGFWVPIGGSDGVPIEDEQKFAGNVFFYGIGPSVEVYQSGRTRFAPVVELVGWRVLGGFATPTGEAKGTNIVNIKFGGRVIWNDVNSLYFGWGRALSEAKWYKNIVRFEYRAAF